MNILFLNEYAPPHQVSGAEYSMMALLKAISQKKDTKVFLLSPDLGDKSSYLKFFFIKKITPGKTLSPLWFNNPIFWLFASWHIIKTIKRCHINVVHVHGKYILPAAIVAKWVTRVPVVITVRDFKFLCPLALCFTNQEKTCSFNYYVKQEIPQFQKNYQKISAVKLVLAKLWQYVLKWFLNQSDKIVAVSPQLKDIYKANGIKNVCAVYNLPPLKSKHQYKPPKQFTLLSVGKLSFGKGTDSLLTAMAQLPNINLILAGSRNNSYKRDFPKNCQYLGKLTHQQTLKLYHQASVFIINSRWPEPLSRAGLEALSFSLPIIASDRGGNKELVKDNGYLVNPDQPENIIKVIKKIFSQNLILLSQNSLKLLASRFNHQKITKIHHQLYQSLL